MIDRSKPNSEPATFFSRPRSAALPRPTAQHKSPGLGLKDAPAIRDAFERDYRRRYGHADAKAPAEFQALHLSAFARLKRPDIARLPRPAVRPSLRTRGESISVARAADDAQIFNRDTLEPGFDEMGPAIIEEYG